MKKICLLLTFVFVMMLGAAALADMDVTAPREVSS